MLIENLNVLVSNFNTECLNFQWFARCLTRERGGVTISNTGQHNLHNFNKHNLMCFLPRAQNTIRILCSLVSSFRSFLLLVVSLLFNNFFIFNFTQEHNQTAQRLRRNRYGVNSLMWLRYNNWHDSLQVHGTEVEGDIDNRPNDLKQLQIAVANRDSIIVTVWAPRVVCFLLHKGLATLTVRVCSERLSLFWGRQIVY